MKTVERLLWQASFVQCAAFARCAALSVAHLWDAEPQVLQYLRGESEDRPAAYEAASAAANTLMYEKFYAARAAASAGYAKAAYPALDVAEMVCRAAALAATAEDTENAKAFFDAFNEKAQELAAVLQDILK